MNRVVIVSSWIALLGSLTHGFLVVTSDRTEVRVTYFPDNTVAVISSVNARGRPHGESRYYSETGKLWAIAVHTHGTLVSYRTYWPSGRLRSEQVEGTGFTATEIEYPDSPEGPQNK